MEKATRDDVRDALLLALGIPLAVTLVVLAFAGCEREPHEAAPPEPLVETPAQPLDPLASPALVRAEPAPASPIQAPPAEATEAPPAPDAPALPAATAAGVVDLVAPVPQAGARGQFVGGPRARPKAEESTLSARVMGGTGGGGYAVASGAYVAGGQGRGKVMKKVASSRALGLAAPVAGFLTRDGGGRAAMGANTEEYASDSERRFVSPTTDPLSTFSIDVDTAAWANVRRFLREGRLPPPDAVRIEEMVNYFEYAYPDPEGPHPFSVTTDLAQAPWTPGHVLMQVGIQGRRVDMQALPASNLVFLVDVSGSMQSPDKLPLLKAAFRLLVDCLRPVDRVAIVAYAGRAGLVLPSTSGAEKAHILAAIDRLQAGGSTAGGAGIQLAYRIAEENHVGGVNRVILATDGDFNVGVSSTSDLQRMVEDKRKSGVALTVLGFGRGNLKDHRMETLADKGDGNYAYIDSVLEAEKVLVKEVGGTLVTIAKDVKIQVEFNPARVKGYRLVGYENRALTAQDFNDDKKDAGELGSGHRVTAFYEIIPAGSDEQIAGVDPLRYQPMAEGEGAPHEWATVKLRYKPPASDTSALLSRVVQGEAVPIREASRDLRFATAVVEAALLLKKSEHKGSATWEGAIARAESAVGADPEGYRQEFVALARVAEGLSGR